MNMKHILSSISAASSRFTEATTRVTVSDLGKAVAAMDAEMAVIERQQLELAASMYHMIRQQVVLSEKYHAVKSAVEKMGGV